MKNKIIFIFYFIFFVLLAWWSWTLTAPNLILSSWPPYWQWQQWLWQNFYSNRQFISQFYLLTLIGFFLAFLFLLAQQKFATVKHFLLTFVLLSLPLLFSFNALSFDVFNYLFNAKMVAVYQANPHQQVALDFSSDPWTRFMHNTHTAAPYGYGWTGISLVPFYTSFGKFLPAWFSFRLLNFILLIAAFFVIFAGQKKVFGKNNWSTLALFFFNPLVLIELIMNMHNDLWMMLPALFALLLLYPQEKNQQFFPVKITNILLSFSLLAFSISIKYASIILVPFWLFLLLLPFLAKIKTKLQFLFQFLYHYLFDFASVFMFLPLLSARSQLFHPWYLIWSLIFLPFVKNKIIQTSLIVLSFSSLLRYLPYLQENGYNDYTLFYQQLISLVPVLIYLLGCYARKVIHDAQKNI